MSSDEHRKVAPASNAATTRRKRRRGRGARRDYAITCARCGASDTVPFKPKPGRELVCASCLEAQGGREATAETKVGGRREGERALFDVTCSHCGQLDQVPFRPRRGGAVLCAKCMADPRVVRVGGRVLHKIVCASCGRHDEVPFKPDAGSRVLCGSCHRDEREARGTARDRFWARHPGVVAGVRVKIEVRCDDCGSIDAVNFAPESGEPVRCRNCAERRLGDGWTMRRRIAGAKLRPSSCGQCGRVDFVPAIEPLDAEPPMCERCRVDGGWAPEENRAPSQSELGDLWLRVV